MSKQVSATELAQLVTKLLTTAEFCDVDERGSFQRFMTDIAKAVCDSCGGEVRQPADLLDFVWYVGIHGNESLPEDGGVWRNFDKEGELFESDSVEGSSAARSIFLEALHAESISTSLTLRQTLTIRRNLVAQEVLSQLPANTVISRELYDADQIVGECLNAMHSDFEFPNWEGRTIGSFLNKFSCTADPATLNVIQVRTDPPNKDGVSGVNISLRDMQEASPATGGSWKLHETLMILFHQRGKN